MLHQTTFKKAKYTANDDLVKMTLNSEIKNYPNDLSEDTHKDRATCL